MGNERLNSALVSWKISVIVAVGSSINVNIDDDSFGFWIFFWSVVIGRDKRSKYKWVFDEDL